MIAAVTLIATGTVSPNHSPGQAREALLGVGEVDARETARSPLRLELTRPRGRAHCPDAVRGVRFYDRAWRSWARKMGAGVAARMASEPRAACPRYLAAVLKAKARAWRKRFERWHAYHYDWRSWLPAKWQRIGACETGYGTIPGDWRWNSGAYQGAFGFAVSSWDGFVPYADPKAGPYPSEAYLATPRQQYEVALAIFRRYGFSGWGCRGA